MSIGLPRGLDFNRVQETFLLIDGNYTYFKLYCGAYLLIFAFEQGVIRVHNLRIWALTMDKVALAAHLAIRKHQY